MAKGTLNKVLLIGNLGADPESRVTPNGVNVTTLRLATTETRTDRQTNQVQEKTEWHRIVLFRNLGEIAGKYLQKGSKVYIEGKLQTRKWQGQSGQDRYMTEIIADRLEMLGGGRGEGKGHSGFVDDPEGYGGSHSMDDIPFDQDDLSF